MSDRSGTMTGRERFEAVFRGEIPDRVPVTLFIQDQGHFLEQMRPDADPHDHLARHAGGTLHLGAPLDRGSQFGEDETDNPARLRDRVILERENRLSKRKRIPLERHRQAGCPQSDHIILRRQKLQQDGSGLLPSGLELMDRPDHLVVVLGFEVGRPLRGGLPQVCGFACQRRDRTESRQQECKSPHHPHLPAQ